MAGCFPQTVWGVIPVDLCPGYAIFQGILQALVIFTAIIPDILWDGCFHSYRGSQALMWTKKATKVTSTLRILDFMQ